MPLLDAKSFGVQLDAKLHVYRLLVMLKRLMYRIFTINSLFRITMKLFQVVLCTLLISAAVLAEDDKDSVGTVIGIDLGTTYSW